MGCGGSSLANGPDRDKPYIIPAKGLYYEEFKASLPAPKVAADQMIIKMQDAITELINQNNGNACQILDDVITSGFTHYQGQDHENMARAYGLYGDAFAKGRKLALAEEYCKYGVEMWKRMGQTSTDAAMMFAELELTGVRMQDLNKFPALLGEAIKLSEVANANIGAVKQKFGDDSYEYMTMAQTLMLINTQAKNHAEAKKQQDICTNIVVSKFGKDSMAYAGFMMARVSQVAQKAATDSAAKAQAKGMANEVRKIYAKNGKLTHWTYAPILLLDASLLLADKKVKKAKSKAQEAKNLAVKTCGPNDSLVTMIDLMLKMIDLASNMTKVKF